MALAVENSPANTGHERHGFSVFIHMHEVKSLSHVRLFVIPWTVAHQAPPSMGLSRQEHWSGLPFTSPAAQDEAIIMDQFLTIFFLIFKEFYKNVNMNSQ